MSLSAVPSNKSETRIISRNELGIQTAIQLYDMGLNVLPVISPNDQLLISKFSAGRYFDPTQKVPFLLRDFFTKRLHRCTEMCHRVEELTAKPCPGKMQSDQFPLMFDQTNLGLMMGRTSKNLVLIDCDSHKSFNQMLDDFTRRKLDFWAHTSSRGGHLYIRVLEGEIKNQPKTEFTNVEVYGRNHFSVIPPSLHYSGEIYIWLKEKNYSQELPYANLPALISISELDWLGVRLIRDYGGVQ